MDVITISADGVIPSREPQKLRKYALDFARSNLDCSATGFYLIERGRNDRCHYRSLTMNGSADVVNHFGKLSDREIPEGLVGVSSWRGRRTWSATQPSRFNCNRFATTTEDYGLSLESALQNELYEPWRRLYGPAHVSDQIRALLYDEDVFVGWFGCLLDHGAVFSKRDQQFANQRILPQILELLKMAHSVECELGSRDGSHLVLDGRGQVVSCSRRLVPFLHEDLRSALGRHAVRLDQGHERRAVFRAGGVRACFLRLDSGVRPLYLVTFSRLTVLRFSPLYRLPPRCRKVVEKLAAGCPVSTLADELELSRETIRSHLKAAYKKLGIENQAQLVRLVESWRKTAL